MVSMSKLLYFFKKLLGFSQDQPVKINWRFALKPIAKNVYKVHITGFIPHEWRLCSQDSNPKGPMPTIIMFNNNEAMEYLGKPVEIGNLREEVCDVFNIKIKFYTTVVNFVQEVMTMNQNIDVRGRIIYMLCNKKKCLEARENKFYIPIN